MGIDFPRWRNFDRTHPTALCSPDNVVPVLLSRRAEDALDSRGVTSGNC